MRSIDFRKDNAMQELQTLADSIDELIKKNRGGSTGIHGFIGERAQVYLSNAWSLIKGDVRICELIDDDGMTDYLEKGIDIQQKACRSNGWLGLDHVLSHRERYPQFNGKYQIPKDFYEDFERLAKMSKKEAGKLCRHEWNLWNEIQKIKKSGVVIEPMRVTYDEIQKDKIYETIDNNIKGIEAEAEKQAESATATYSPSIKAGIRTAAVSSVIEGGLSGVFKAAEIRIKGKHFRDYDKQDLKAVGKASAEGCLRGVVRGAAVYLVDNYTNIPGYIAGSSITLLFDGSKIIKEYTAGDISGKECLYTFGKSAAVTVAGAAGAKIVGKICPIPIVGEVFGGFVFSLATDKGFGLIEKRIGSNRDRTIPHAV